MKSILLFAALMVLTTSCRRQIPVVALHDSFLVGMTLERRQIEPSMPESWVHEEQPLPTFVDATARAQDVSVSPDGCLLVVTVPGTDALLWKEWGGTWEFADFGGRQPKVIQHVGRVAVQNDGRVIIADSRAAEIVWFDTRSREVGERLALPTLPDRRAADDIAFTPGRFLLESSWKLPLEPTISYPTIRVWRDGNLWGTIRVPPAGTPSGAFDAILGNVTIATAFDTAFVFLDRGLLLTVAVEELGRVRVDRLPWAFRPRPPRYDRTDRAVKMVVATAYTRAATADSAANLFWAHPSQPVVRGAETAEMGDILWAWRRADNENPVAFQLEYKVVSMAAGGSALWLLTEKPRRGAGSTERVLRRLHNPLRPGEPSVCRAK